VSRVVLSKKQTNDRLISASSDRLFDYFKDNQQLLKKLLYAAKIDKKNDDYYIYLGKFGGLGLYLEPVLVMNFTNYRGEGSQHKIDMTLIRTEISTPESLKFEANINGQITFTPEEINKTIVKSEVSADITLFLPSLLGDLSRGPIELLGKTILTQLMRSFTFRAFDLLQEGVS
jgi:hypothetical protein